MAVVHGQSLMIQWSANLPVSCVSPCQEMLPFWPFRALLPAELSARIDQVLSFLSVESHSLALAHFSTHCLSATCAPVWSNRMEKTVTHAGKSFVSWGFCLHDVDTLLFLLLVWSLQAVEESVVLFRDWSLWPEQDLLVCSLLSSILCKRCLRVINTSQTQEYLMELIADMRS